MPLFLTVREGPTPEESKVVFASADPLLVCALGEALACRLGASKVPRALRPAEQSNTASEE